MKTRIDFFNNWKPETYIHLNYICHWFHLLGAVSWIKKEKGNKKISDIEIHIHLFNFEIRITFDFS